MFIDNNQIKAINHTYGPALVIAGPGCGKTKVITERINHLVGKKIVQGKNIVAISFTRFSSKELEERTIHLNENLKSVFYGTFHSFFLKILITHSNYTYDSVINEIEKKSILKKILTHKLNFKPVSSDFLDALINEIENENENSFNGRAISLTRVQNNIDLIVKSYESWKIKNNKLDFNDILYKTYSLLYNNEFILKDLKSQYKYFIIDEFQDINEIQYKIIQLLVKDSQNLFVVGDEDQSIYSFRGSNPKYITDFLKTFPQGKIYKIISSYRCPKELVTLSNNLISYNKLRTQKDIISANDTKGLVTIKEYENPIYQSVDISRKIIAENLDLNTVMILYRTNKESLFLMKSFSDFNIKYYLKNFNYNILNSFVVKDIISYIEFSLNENLESLKKIRNKPNRNISNKDIDDMFNKKLKITFTWNNKVRNLCKEIAIIKELGFIDAINFILEGIGYDRYARNYYKSNNIDSNCLDDIINGFMDLFNESLSLKDGLENFYKYLSLIENASFKNQSGVLLTTVHGAKGLEKNNVFIVSLNEGYFPHKKIVSIEQMEEERRLMYVALTRSKKNLYISYIKSKEKNLKPSLFLSEMGFK